MTETSRRPGRPLRRPRLPPGRARLRLGRPVPFHPPLFAAYPVLYLWSANVSQVYADDVMPLLVRVVAVALIVFAAAAVVLRDARRAAIIVTAITVPVLVFGHVDRLLQPVGVGHAAQLAAWIALIVGAVLVAWRRRRWLASATSALNIVAVALVAMTLTSILPTEARRLGAGIPVIANAPAAASDGTPQTTRDIYYLVLDRYGSEEALRLLSGFDNDLPEWLRERGFFVADDSLANYPRTPLSLGATLNLGYLDDVARRYAGTGDFGPAHHLVEENAVTSFIKHQGHRYFHIGSWWDPSRTSKAADVNLNVAEHSEFTSVFLDSTMEPLLTGRQRAGEAPAGAHEERPRGLDSHRYAALYQFEQLERMPSLPGPKFVFAHVLLPHEPYVFRADGSPTTPDEGRTAVDPRLQVEQLRYTNTRIRAVIDRLLAVPPDRRPIIVLQSDEGPYLDASKTTRSRALRIRYGILNAFYLPDPGEPAPYTTITPVNTFRLLFSRYFGADLPLLPDRNYGWPTVLLGSVEDFHRRTLYDFTDITQELRSGRAQGPPRQPNPTDD